VECHLLEVLFANYLAVITHGDEPHVDVDGCQIGLEVEALVDIARLAIDLQSDHSGAHLRLVV
jgi:hypothetical protein